MAELISQLGINWKLLLASIVNFFILFFLLRKFAYRPILSMLEKREKMIADSVERSKALEQAAKDLDAERAAELKQVRIEASKVLEQAQQTAGQLKAESVAAAKAEAARLMDTTKAELKAEREALHRQVKAEVADLVVAATEKILDEKLTADADRKLVERTLEKVEKRSL